MAWKPQHAHFAVVALFGPPTVRAARTAAGLQPLVLLVGDDFAEILARRAVLIELRPGCPLQVVWGLDGEPVTVEQMHQLTSTRAPAAGTLRADGEPALGPMDRLPPQHPRAVRPESCGTPRRPAPHREALPGEAPAASCSACRARTRNLLVAEEFAPCDSLGRHAPNHAEVS